VDNGNHNGMPNRHRWIGSLLTRSGSVLESAGDGLFHYRLGVELAEQLSRDRVTITFRKRIAEKDGVELASPGSWFHDQLLSYARKRGRIVEGYLSRKEDLDQESLFRSRRRGFLALKDLRERRYGTILIFTFRISYYSEPAEEAVRHVIYDCQRRRVMKRPIQRKLILAEADTPDGAFADPPKTNVRTAFAAAWETVQDHIEARVHDIQQEGRQAIEEKIRTVENYYRQLLAEEKRLLKTRASRRGEQESREKIELLKLEWERRVKEETERLKPQVVATLTAVARVWVPMERWRCSLEEKGVGVEKDLWLDLARGEVWEPAKPRSQRKRC
jgi:hypothetical protein